MVTLDEGNAYFSPIKQVHSISEVIFFIKVALDSRDLPLSDYLGRVSSDQLMISDFNQINFIEEISAEIRSEGNNSVTFSPPLTQRKGLEMRSIVDDDVLWLIQILNNQISIHCFDYSRWGAVWKKVRNYIDNLFLNLDYKNIESIALAYVDQFKFNGSLAEYVPTKLFDESSAYLPPLILSKGELWHSHTGWFELVKDQKILNQLNIDSTFNLIQDDNVHLTSIFHNQVIRNIGLKMIGLNKDNLELLDCLYSSMHHANKRLLNNLLKENIKKDIFLGGNFNEQ